jgi:hypothetical protein
MIEAAEKKPRKNAADPNRVNLFCRVSPGAHSKLKRLASKTPGSMSDYLDQLIRRHQPNANEKPLRKVRA